MSAIAEASRIVSAAAREATLLQARTSADQITATSQVSASNTISQGEVSRQNQVTQTNGNITGGTSSAHNSAVSALGQAVSGG